MPIPQFVEFCCLCFISLIFCWLCYCFFWALGMIFFCFFYLQCIDYLQCFDAVGWVAGRASGLYKTEYWGAGIVICLERGADLHTAQLMSLPFASVKSRLVLPFWYRLTRVVLDKGPLTGVSGNDFRTPPLTNGRHLFNCSLSSASWIRWYQNVGDPQMDASLCYESLL